MSLLEVGLLWLEAKDQWNMGLEKITSPKESLAFQNQLVEHRVFFFSLAKHKDNRKS